MLWQLLVWACRDPLKNSLAGQHTVVLGEGGGGGVIKGTLDGIVQVTSIEDLHVRFTMVPYKPFFV